MSTLKKKDKKKYKLPKVVIILGPTATGKTKLALKLALKFDGEIISADSRQVYREMDIGTGKDLESYQININGKLKKIKYHLIDVLNPNQKFNVAKYKKLAIKIIKDILKRGKLPIVVGGTGLYISAIVDNYDIPKIKPDLKVRQKLAKMTVDQKIKLLKKLDPASLKFVALKNPRRLDRALEVCLAGYKFSELRQKKAPLFDVLQIGISMPREIINQRINKRVDLMIKNGLVEETKNIIKKFPPLPASSAGRRRTSGKNIAPLETIGYKEIVEYLQKNVGAQNLVPEEIIELIKTRTRQFAKRQMTWFKINKNIKWIENIREAEKFVNEFVS